MNNKNGKLDKIKEIIENRMPANKLYGLVVVDIDNGYVKIRVPFRNEFIGDALQNVWHGGILARIADTAGGIATVTTTLFPQDKVNTIDIRINYLKGATDRDIFAIA